MFSRLAFAKTRRLLFAPARTYERPTIASVAPALGPLGGGTQIRVVGTGFTMTGDTTVTIGGAPVAVIVQSEFVLFVTTPAHAPGAVTLAVTTPGGTASNAWTYQSATPAPTVSSADPDTGDAAGPHAGLMTITGANFVNGGSFGVTIGGTAALNVSFVNATTITCRPPAKASSQYTIRVTNNDGQFGDLVNGYRAWTPAEIANVEGYFDSRKGITVVSVDHISQVNDQSSARAMVQATDAQRPTLAADVFGTGVPAMRFVQASAQCLSSNAGSRALASGVSAFFVGKWTSVDTVATHINDNPPLTVNGDTQGWLSFGASGGQLALVQFLGTFQPLRGASLNDGVVRLCGWTFSSAGASSTAKAYVGVAQQGADAVTTYDTVNNVWNAIGSGWTVGTDTFDGDLGMALWISGVMSGADLALLNKWARLSFGTP